MEAVKLVAICVLVAWCFWWIIRDDQRTKRESAARLKRGCDVPCDVPAFRVVSACDLHDGRTHR